MKCKNCGRLKYDHRAKVFSCPVGKRSRVGFTNYSDGDVFEPLARTKRLNVAQARLALYQAENLLSAIEPLLTPKLLAESRSLKMSIQELL